MQKCTWRRIDRVHDGIVRTLRSNHINQWLHDGAYPKLAGPGFRQAGTIENVNERANTLTQRTEHGNVTYNLHELRLGMGDQADFASCLTVGKRVDIAITGSESVEVTPVAVRLIERGHDLGHGR